MNRKERIAQRCSAMSGFRVPCHDEVVLVKEDLEIDGRILKRTVEKTVNPSDNFRHFSADQFTTENLLAIGATDHFRPLASLPTSDVDSALDAMDRASAMLDAAERAKASAAADKSAAKAAASSVSSTTAPVTSTPSVEPTN